MTKEDLIIIIYQGASVPLGFVHWCFLCIALARNQVMTLAAIMIPTAVIAILALLIGSKKIKGQKSTLKEQ